MHVVYTFYTSGSSNNYFRLLSILQAHPGYGLCLVLKHKQLLPFNVTSEGSDVMSLCEEALSVQTDAV